MFLIFRSQPNDKIRQGSLFRKNNQWILLSLNDYLRRCVSMTKCPEVLRNGIISHKGNHEILIFYIVLKILFVNRDISHTLSYSRERDLGDDHPGRLSREIFLPPSSLLPQRMHKQAIQNFCFRWWNVHTPICRGFFIWSEFHVKRNFFSQIIKNKNSWISSINSRSN